MFETMAAFNLVEHFYGRHFEPPRAPAGYPRVLAPLRRPYQSADGHVCMMPYTDAHWRDFFTAAGRPDRRRRALRRHRCTHAATSRPCTSLPARSCAATAAWLALCESLQIPVAKVNGLDELPDDPHLQATGFFSRLQDPALGTCAFRRAGAFRR